MGLVLGMIFLSMTAMGIDKLSHSFWLQNKDKDPLAVFLDPHSENTLTTKEAIDKFNAFNRYLDNHSPKYVSLVRRYPDLFSDNYFLDLDNYVLNVCNNGNLITYEFDFVKTCKRVGYFYKTTNNK